MLPIAVWPKLKTGEYLHFLNFDFMPFRVISHNKQLTENRVTH